MAQSVYSYSDLIRLTAKSLAQAQAMSVSEAKSQLQTVAKVYTAVSKNINHNLKKYLLKLPEDVDQGDQSAAQEIEVPYFGTVIAQGRHKLGFSTAQTLNEEAGMAPTPKFAALDKKLIRQEISMGKIAEVCMIGREQVKIVLQSLSSQIGSIVKMGYTVLLDFRLSETYPNKILAFSRTQNGQFVDKNDVASLLRANHFKVQESQGSGDDTQSKISAKRSLYDNRVQTPKMSQKSGYSGPINKAALTSGFQQTRKLGALNGSVFDQDPETIIARVLGSNQKPVQNVAYTSLMPEVPAHIKVLKSPQPVSSTPVSVFKRSAVGRFFDSVNPALAKGTGFSIPESPIEEDPAVQQHRIKKLLVQEEQKRQIQDREKWKQNDFQSNLDFEKEIVRQDNERASLDRLNRRQRKQQMISTLRETLTNQQNFKKDRRNQEKAEDVFNYFFPFDQDSPAGFFISPKKYTNDEDLAQQLQPDYHKQLPMQHDLQVPQFAHRLLKDHQKQETIKNAYSRVRATLDSIKEDKLKEREKFISMMQAIKFEDELKEKLRRENLKDTKSTLEKQMKYKQEQRDQDEKFHKSFVSVGGLPSYVDLEQRTFSQDGSLEGRPVQKRNTMSLVTKSQIRDELKKQIAERESSKKQEKQQDLDYGMRLNLMARNMQKKDQERIMKQREMQFKLMTSQWNDMIKDKEELKEIEKIFKN